jgi:hypothetical protein
MSKEDLIDISTRPDAQELRRKGGSVKSEAKSRAARLRGAKMANLDNVEEKVLAIVRDPEFSAVQIAEVIMDMLENEDLTQRTKVELIGKMVQAHTAIHGAKTKNLNVNIDMTADNVIERLKNWKKQKQQEEQHDAVIEVLV